jgi:hypothetical protein
MANMVGMGHLKVAEFFGHDTTDEALFSNREGFL